MTDVFTPDVKQCADGLWYIAEEGTWDLVGYPTREAAQRAGRTRKRRDLIERGELPRQRLSLLTRLRLWLATAHAE